MNYCWTVLSLFCLRLEFCLFQILNIFKNFVSTISYMTCYSQLVNCGVSNATGVLEFCQAVTDLVDRHADSAPNPEAMWRLWSIVANTLHQHILKVSLFIISHWKVVRFLVDSAPNTEAMWRLERGGQHLTPTHP